MGFYFDSNASDDSQQTTADPGNQFSWNTGHPLVDKLLNFAAPMDPSSSILNLFPGGAPAAGLIRSAEPSVMKALSETAHPAIRATLRHLETKPGYLDILYNFDLSKIGALGKYIDPILEHLAGKPGTVDAPTVQLSQHLRGSPLLSTAMHEIGHYLDLGETGHIQGLLDRNYHQLGRGAIADLSDKVYPLLSKLSHAALENVPGYKFMAEHNPRLFDSEVIAHGVEDAVSNAVPENTKSLLQLIMPYLGVDMGVH